MNCARFQMSIFSTGLDNLLKSVWTVEKRELASQ